MYVCSYIALVNTETQTGIIHIHTSEHTQAARTQTQVLGQGGTLLVRVATTQRAIPGGDSIRFQCVLSFPTLEIAGKP